MRGRVLRHDVRPRARPPTQGFAGAARQAQPPARSVLKMNTVIRPASAFLRSSGIGMPFRLAGGNNISAKVWPCAPQGDQSSIRSAIHLHGSAPDRTSRAVRGSRAGTHGEPDRGPAQPCAARSACSKGWRKQWHGIRCRPVTARTRDSPSRSGRQGLPARSRVALRVEQLRAWPRGPCHDRLRGRCVKRRVTTATPFAPRWSRPGGPREPVVHTRRALTSMADHPLDAEMAGIADGA